MKVDMKPFAINKKQLFILAVVIALGFFLGVFILKDRVAKGAHEEGHASHAQAEAHADEEHHSANKEGANGERGTGHDHAKEHADTEHHAAPQGQASKARKKGPHGGSLFTEGSLGLEAKLAETAGEPRLQIWLFEGGTPLPHDAAKISATVSRLTGETQTLSFSPEAGSLISREIVAEPHAFDISIVAKTSGDPVMFVLTQEEGKVELSDAQISAASITVATAGAAQIKLGLQLPGEIRLNEDKTSHVVPRMAGVVERVHADLGQPVKKGQVLAVIASPVASEQRSEWQSAQKRFALAKTTYVREKRLWEQKISAEQDYLQAGQALHEAEVAVTNAQQKLSAYGLAPGSTAGLNRFELRAPLDGMVIEKHLSLGEAIKEDTAVFTVSDLTRVWAEINVPAKDLSMVRVGEKVAIKATTFDASASGHITFVGSLIGEQTRMAKARAVLVNPKGAWRPGLFVNVEVTSSEAEVPVSVASDAIQTVGDNSVVFVKVKGGFIAQPVKLGRSDGKRIEVLEGLKAGTPYAAAGSFVVKSELGKASAEHTH